MMGILLLSDKVQYKQACSDTEICPNLEKFDVAIILFNVIYSIVSSESFHVPFVCFQRIIVWSHMCGSRGGTGDPDPTPTPTGKLQEYRVPWQYWSGSA